MGSLRKTIRVNAEQQSPNPNSNQNAKLFRDSYEVERKDFQGQKSPATASTKH